MTPHRLPSDRRRLLLHRHASAFRRTVYAHYRRHGRSFPWRTTRDPYKILVSELMLQQTQTKRVVPFYRAFVKRFPTVRALAAARQTDVLQMWQGLGYNRRALALQRAAQKIVAEHRGTVPRNLEALQRLPGIGPYTAGAIAAFAYDVPGAFLETNIRTALIHEFFPKARSVSDARLLPLAEAVLDRRHPGRWYSALMDYGAWLKTEHGNATRRSSTYTRQSPFADSDRSVRGKILRALLQKPLTLRTLAKQIEETDARTRKLTKALQNEGFLKERRGRLTIA